MKLAKVLDQLNSIEKNSFIKVIEKITDENPKNSIEIEKILSDTDKGLKEVDSINITRVFNLISDEFVDYVTSEFVNTTSQLDILVDILIRDGNSLMKQNWFAKLYEKEIIHINKKKKEFLKELKSEKSEISNSRKRDYEVYKACLETAYFNDEENNQEPKITSNELSILLKLAEKLELSQEEVKLINYIIIPVKKQEIDDVVKELKNLGIIFYSRKNNLVYVPDEIVMVLRKIRGKEIADKYLRRVLKVLRDGQINSIARKHNIDRKLTIGEKRKEIISEGISFSGILMNDVHKDGTNLTEKKKFITDFALKGLGLKSLKGTTLDNKVSSLINHFELVEKDDKIGISAEGYDKLLIELKEELPNIEKLVKAEFEIEEENIFSSNFLVDYNIKPKDILDIIPSKDIETFCQKKSIKQRGDKISNILEVYKDSENLYLENYENIGYRDYSTLKENNIQLKEAEIGIKFEDLTKKIFEGLGFNVDEDLRRSLNTKKDKIDLLINLGNNELIIIECKTVKESGYNKFSAVSRQIKSYINLIGRSEYRVVKSLLIAPDFTDDFINDCGDDFELNLSLIKASSLYNIFKAYKSTSKQRKFHYQLLMRDVVIQEDRIIKAISK